MPLFASAAAHADPAGGGGWSERFEVHGFLTSKAYFRSPDFEERIEPSSWRTELNLETELRLYEGDLRLGLFGVLRPTWDGIYEIQGDTWGKRTHRAAFGTAPAFPDDPGFAAASREGDALPCAAGGLAPGCGGARVRGEFTVVNSDTATFFSGERVAAVAIDDTVFFGRVTAPVTPRSSRQPSIGGNATGETYRDLRDNFAIPGFGPAPNGNLPMTSGLDASLSAATLPLSTPLNAYQGALGDRGSFERSSFDLNRREEQLAFDCLDNAHPWCFVRELYLEGSYGRTFFRLGRQQIVWGKTDSFRLQDRINPVDLGTHNIFPDLEERRIPLLALDVIHGFGSVGPFQDVSLELAWVFDRFVPDQFGQCGEPYAFTAACGARADAGAHQLFNFGAAGVDEVHWKLANTEPGARLEFRLPRPSMAFSLSAFYTFQDQPVARFRNHYSVSNPNPAAMLFLQGLATTAPGAFPVGTPLAAIIDTLAQTPGAPFAYSGGVWLGGFDPYARDAGGAPTGTLLDANRDLQNAWYALANVVGGGCVANENCGDSAVLALPWTASEAVLEYPRLWALGASLDYQIPRLDTILRVEIASDLDRHIQDSSQRDGVSTSPVFMAALGLDRATFIPFLNPERTAFLSFQTFVEHVVDYRDRGAVGGMVPDETSVISTAYMQNFWRNDSLILTNFVAVDWNAQAIVTGPSLRWFYDSHLYFDVGVNLLWGRSRTHNVRNVCADATLSCLGDPATWQDGNWQTLNAGLAREAMHPWWGRQSFADDFMRRRDEVWAGVTYQF